ncbi:hypothetical protein GGR54DRAFT_599921 [Hypoxylon sp. NC1633]|nr:hypothetical protein GGR54DRAFT_599921 [Hypoxylon sp. NC1633]
MAHSQDQSIFFRLPLELREQVYQFCQPWYMVPTRFQFSQYDKGIGGLLDHSSSGSSALLRTCKKIKSEAEPWIHQQLAITCGRGTEWDTIGLCIQDAGTVNLRMIKKVTMVFEILVGEPSVILDMMEHLVDRAPKLQALEITWGEAMFCPILKPISFEKNIKPWFPILAKAGKLKTLKLRRVARTWTTAIEDNVKQHNPEVNLEMEVFDIKKSMWCKWTVL